jgi:hypothetical protein
MNHSKGRLAVQISQRHFVHFFTSPETAEKWTTEHPGTFALSVEEAHALGHLTNQRNGGDALRG